MKKEKNKWFRLLAFVPLLVFLVFTNIYQDPANIYHDESKEIAGAILDGKSAFNGNGNGDLREVKHNVIMGMPDNLECIAVGPSLVMCVNKDIVGTNSFMNLGVSGADLYDILAQFGLMDTYGKKTKRVIFCVDSYFFDESIYGNSDSNDALMDYTNHMLGIISCNSLESGGSNTGTDKITMLKQAFSITYFQAAWKQVIVNNTYSMKDNRWGIVGKDFDGSKPCYDPDGSWNYAVSFQNNGIDYLLDEVENYDVNTNFSYGRHISQYSKEVFEKLIKYLRENDVEVEIFLCPLPPSLWDKVESDSENIFILDEMTTFTTEMANKYNLKMTGSYNPYDLGMKDEDFYDARHVRRESLADYFDFTE